MARWIGPQATTKNKAYKKTLNWQFLLAQNDGKKDVPPMGYYAQIHGALLNMLLSIDKRTISTAEVIIFSQLKELWKKVTHIV